MPTELRHSINVALSTGLSKGLGRGLPPRGYKIRQYVSGRSKRDGTEYKNFSLTVPNDIAEALPKNMQFTPRMTDEGLLFVPTTQTESAIELPEWARAQESVAEKQEQSTNNHINNNHNHANPEQPRDTPQPEA